MKLDEYDLKIINMLKENARMSISEMAKALNLSRQTVKSRIERLEKEGIITGYTVMLSSALENDSSVFLIVEAELEKLEKVEEIVEINRITSRRYLIRVLINDMNELARIIERTGFEVLEILPVIERVVRDRPFRARVPFKCDYCGKEAFEEPVIYKYRNKVYVLCCKTCLREFKTLIS
ncbi:winged helix-turn-helix transcriptional regulator [Archaeoglobus neptunius]|uniref:winged helix-turn-helix transcriptional regulator n=1 Tax=Archaeoglobus neptunius TaxID=2798580 RepID=UPI001926B83E|nr:winged helix-turn-helix transcriptional regulator [Archaeoglobus neptunius]